MKKHLLLAIAAISSILFFAACEKHDHNDDDHDHGTTGAVTLEFEHGWGPSYDAWAIGQQKVHPVTGDTITFTQLRYYITNVQLQKTDNSWWTQPESYYLIDASSTSGSMVKMTNVPAGEYKAVKFIIGVDSLRNVSGAQSGVLSASEGMFWDWNTGYIQVRAEGNSPSSGTGKFLYHLGGFSGPDNALQTKEISFGAGTLTASPTSGPMIHLKVNTARFWHGGVKIKDLSVIHMPGAAAASMAKNFADGVVFDHLHP